MTMSLGLRKFALAVHLTVSVGWIGAVAAYVALDVAAATSEAAETLRAAYIGMELIARNVIVPLAFASLLTGIVMSVGTNPRAQSVQAEGHDPVRMAQATPQAAAE